MITEKYDIIAEADSIIKQWDDDLFDFNKNGRTYYLTGEYWVKNYSKQASIATMFAFAISEFKKHKDIIQRVDGLDDRSGREELKQESSLKMLDLADDIVSLRNLAKGEDCVQPGQGYQKRLKDLNEQVKALTLGKDEWEKTARDALELSQNTNSKYAQLETEYKTLKEYGEEKISARFVQEAKKYGQEKTHPRSKLEESTSDNNG